MEEITSVSVKALVEAFDFEQITGDEESLNRQIVMADTNRPGLELAGFFENSQVKRLVVLGDKEIAYISTMSVQKQRKAFDFITNEITPAIIITKGHKCPDVLKRCAKRKNFPVLSSESATTRLIVDLVAFLDEKLASSQCLHGGLLSIYGKGVLIRGESGMGKSEIALELIKRGHLLVADDRVDCYRIHNKIVGKAPELLSGMLEIRGIGIINVARMFGVSSVLPKTQVDFQVNLEMWKPDQDYDRVGIEEKKHENILGVDIPKIVVPVREGRSMAVIIESAVTNYMLSEMGMDSAKEFEQRVLDYIEKNKNAQ
ncbi:HPr(Ser) kinase/phosphatase [Absiella sp. AM54-8XD]|uniref:HPr(Ser) kinase/phosphatase n=1 Tax=Erysipelotrichaceae TaxID=128827 RepID=UPI000E429A26|nr:MULTISPECIES: HPr(Ser) kinase/phosphatase [unclassified Absiella]RGC25703.1 HPr(Ser) kinase/phosphatase [Absiella sp. AM54-8XD]RGC53409.1 HPr(Ser) kinase/phosphatase [Absiella sp. AM29-15]